MQGVVEGGWGVVGEDRYYTVCTSKRLFVAGKQEHRPTRNKEMTDLRERIWCAVT